MTVQLDSGPKVTFLTPVYNGAEHLRACVDSILAQTHGHWEYVIVNNCSTDDTLAIANEYAARDPRIRVYDNERFVTADENHNIAFGYVSDDSAYTKVVSADDWIEPECVEKLVAVGEAHPSVGVVGCYQQRSNDGFVKWKGIDLSVRMLPGGEVCRRALLEGLRVMGAPTSVLYRSDLVRRRCPDVFPHARPNADNDAHYEMLGETDLGFVHEVLSYERVHVRQVTTELRSVGAGDLAYLEAVRKYGPVHLTPSEFDARLRDLEGRYYRTLGRSVWRFRGPQYWRFHRRELETIGVTFDAGRVLRSALVEAVRELRHPGDALRTALRYVRRLRGDSVPAL